MKYLCLIYTDREKMRSIPDAEIQRCRADCDVYMAELEKRGHFIAAQRLHPAENATTLRHHDGKVTLTDGPFAETKEQLGGFYLIEARDLNEAIRIASDIPPGRFGSIEVRPIRD